MHKTRMEIILSEKLCTNQNIDFFKYYLKNDVFNAEKIAYFVPASPGGTALCSLTDTL